MSDETKTILGTIFWPLYPYKVIRSDLVHSTLADHNKIVCPNLCGESLCKLSNFEDFPNNKCKFANNSIMARRKTCPYSEYHTHFLLTIPPSSESIIPPIAKYDISDGCFADTIDMGLGVDSKTLAVSLDYFPQHDEIIMSDKKTCQEAKIDAKCFGMLQPRIKIEKSYNLDEKAQKFYAASEYVLWKDNDNSLAETAFLALVKQQTVNNVLPNAQFKKENDYIIPVALSFFGDKRIDAMLSLMIREPEPIADHPTKEENFILQALLRLNEPIKRQREMFLYHWRQRLRSLVGEVFYEKVEEINLTVEEYKKGEKEAKKEAVKFGANALQRMILVLLAEKKTVCESDNMFYQNLFTVTALEEDTCSETDFNCFKGTPQIKASHADRCKFICEFCKQARISIIEGLGAGKLKGALSRETSAALVDIAKDDPVKARVLIRGDAGGGKGVAAEDFHAHCMERIAKASGFTLDIIQKSSLGKFITSPDFKVVVSDWAKVLIAEPGKDADIKSKVVYEYFDGIHKALSGIKQLPPLASVSKQKQTNNAWEFQKQQVEGTAWWLWVPVKEEGDLKPLYVKALKACVDSLSEENAPEGVFFADLFIAALSLKILHELINEKDWSFNFFQVNCGIMGGQNSELSESIRRLFGQTDYDKAGKALPGLFQLCSYVGGTLFLDEIADAPVRIQDNLLRPLEEGKVSRPGWETINEKVGNIRIVGATFKNLFKLANQYEETVSSGNPKGFRPDLLTRLTRNPPVTITPVWHHFVPSARYTPQALRNQFCYVMVEAFFIKTKLPATFWDNVYDLVMKKLEGHCTIAIGHLPDEIDRRRHFASKITMRFLKALADRAATMKDKSKLDPSTAGHLDLMLDYLLCDSTMGNKQA